MDDMQPQASMPKNATSMQILGVFEALLFVVAGALAVGTPSPLSLLILGVILSALLLIRWLHAAPDRKAEAPAYLSRRYELRGLLLDDLQEILRFVDSDSSWTFQDLVLAVQWWFDEELLVEWRESQEHIQKLELKSKHSGAEARRAWRTSLISIRLAVYRVERWLEGLMLLKSEELIGVVARLENSETARIVLTRAIAEDFVIERLEAKPTFARITYSINIAKLRRSSEGPQHN